LVVAAAVSAPTRDGETRCKTVMGGQVVCGNLVIGITLEQYEAGLKTRAEEIRAEEAAIFCTPLGCVKQRGAREPIPGLEWGPPYG